MFKMKQKTGIFLILVTMFVASFFIKEKVILIALGIAFVFIGIWLIPKLVIELAFFGAIFGIVEWWKYWGVTTLNFIPMPDGVYIFTAAFMATWIILRLTYTAALFIPFLAPLNAFLHKPIW